VAKREPAIGYTCGVCHKPAPPAAQSSALALLELCKGCHDERFAKGMKAQQEADAKAQGAARG
jgi:hypothetical protein